MKYTIVISLISLSLWGFSMTNNQLENNLLRVAFPSSDRVTNYEPTRIHIDYQYIFLESIYSPLVKLSDDTGVPISSIAKEHFWKGNELHFVIRDDLRTIDGYQITVDDVIFSLKRVLVLAENTHGDFKALVCPQTTIKSIDDHCDGISKQGQTLILKLQEQKDFLISMLASIDFAIIPSSAVDPETLKIKDYRNTSGPYYVDLDKGDGHITLKANTNHFLYSDSMATQIDLIPTAGLTRNQVVKMFTENKIDFITTIEGLHLEDVQGIDRSEATFHETIYIKSQIAFVTDQGMKRITRTRRLAFAKTLQKSFHDHFKGKEGYRPSKEFFLPLSDGGFHDIENSTLSTVMESTELEESGQGIHLAIFRSESSEVSEYVDIAKSNMPNLRADKSKGIPAFTQLQEKDMPDFLIVYTDSGFLEDIGFLSYSMSAGLFGFSKSDGTIWLQNYMNIPTREERLGKLKQMHLKSLVEGRLIPLVSSPYIAIAHKPWKPNLSELFANCPLWKIRKN